MARRLFGLLLVMVLVFSLSMVVVADPNTLVIGIGAEAPGLDPRVEVDVPAFERINIIMEPLVVFNVDMELEPRLATEWEISDDLLTMTFLLREGVTWHDGEPFTAADVKYTFDWVLDPENDAPNRPLYADIEEVEIEDDYTVHFHLSSSNVFLLNNMARMNVVPKHRGDDTDFRTNPVGTGPYMFERWVRDDRLELKAYNDYWGGEPITPNLIIKTIPESSTRLMAFEAGEIDVYQGGIVPLELSRLEIEPSYVVQRSPSTGYDYFAFNTKNPPLDNVYVRQAICHLINREAIVERVWAGIGTPGVTPVPAALPWYNDDVRRYDYSLEKARELLEKAGYPDGGFTLEFYTNAENAERIRMGELLQFELARVGIYLNINTEEWGAYLDRILGTDDYDVYLLGWSGQLDPDRAMYRQFHTDGAMNDTYISDERLDYLLEKGLTLPPDSQESLDVYREAQDIVVELAPYGFIRYYEEVALQHDYLKGYTIHPYPANAWMDAHLFWKDK